MIESKEVRERRLREEAEGRALRAKLYADKMNLPVPALAEKPLLTPRVDEAGNQARGGAGKEPLNSVHPRGGQTLAGRQERWRQKNKPKRAEYMRGWRAKQKGAA